MRLARDEAYVAHDGVVHLPRTVKAHKRACKGRSQAATECLRDTPRAPRVHDARPLPLRLSRPPSLTRTTVSAASHTPWPATQPRRLMLSQPGPQPSPADTDAHATIASWSRASDNGEVGEQADPGHGALQVRERRSGARGPGPGMQINARGAWEGMGYVTTML